MADKRLMNKINKKFGDNAIRVASELRDADGIERIPTASVSLDIALGGGIPVGRFIELSGALSSTKTTQTLHIIKHFQEAGYTCALFDIEGTTEISYMEKIGVNVEELYLIHPDGQEECQQMIIDLQREGAIDLAVVDSIEALAPTKEVEKEMEDSMQVGMRATLLGELFRKWTSVNNRLSRENKQPLTLIGINQLREKPMTMGDPEYTPGGRAKGFYSSVNIRLRKSDWIVEGTGKNKTVVGQTIKFKISKNKTATPFRTGEFDFYMEENEAEVKSAFNDNFKEIIIEAIAWDLIERRGAYYYLDNRENGIQGKDALIDHLKENPEVVEKLKKEILKLSQTTR
jgi:recombination protein RecA